MARYHGAPFDWVCWFLGTAGHAGELPTWFKLPWKVNKLRLFGLITT